MAPAGLSGRHTMAPSPYVDPTFLPTLQAIFASWRFAAKPMEQVMCVPTFRASVLFSRAASSSGSLRPASSSRQANSSIDFTVSIGITDSISASSVLWARR